MGNIGRRFIAIDGHEASFFHEMSPLLKKCTVISCQ
jgi:hypothetical protein